MTHRRPDGPHTVSGEAIDRAGSGVIVVFVEAPFFEELAQVAPFRSRQGGRCGHVALRLGQHARQEFRFKLLKRLGFGGRVHESIDHQLATIPPFSAVRGGSVDRTDLNHRAVGEEKLPVHPIFGGVPQFT